MIKIRVLVYNLIFEQQKILKGVIIVRLGDLETILTMILIKTHT